MFPDLIINYDFDAFTFGLLEGFVLAFTVGFFGLGLKLVWNSFTKLSS